MVAAVEAIEAIPIGEIERLVSRIPVIYLPEPQRQLTVQFGRWKKTDAVSGYSLGQYGLNVTAITVGRLKHLSHFILLRLARK